MALHPNVFTVDPGGSAWDNANRPTEFRVLQRVYPGEPWREVARVPAAAVSATGQFTATLDTELVDPADGTGNVVVLMVGGATRFTDLMSNWIDPAAGAHTYTLKTKAAPTGDGRLFNVQLVDVNQNPVALAGVTITAYNSHGAFDNALADLFPAPVSAVTDSDGKATLTGPGGSHFQNVWRLKATLPEGSELLARQKSAQFPAAPDAANYGPMDETIELLPPNGEHTVSFVIKGFRPEMLLGTPFDFFLSHPDGTFNKAINFAVPDASGRVVFEHVPARDYVLECNWPFVEWGIDGYWPNLDKSWDVTQAEVFTVKGDTDLGVFDFTTFTRLRRDPKVELRRAGLTKRGAEAVLAALSEPPAGPWLSVSDGQVSWGDLPPGTPAVVTHPDDGTGLELYIVNGNALPTSGSLPRPAHGQAQSTYVAEGDEAEAWGVTSYATAPGFAVNGSTLATGDFAYYDQAWEDVVDVRPLASEPVVRTDWNAVLRRGDLSPRQVKTLRELLKRKAGWHKIFNGWAYRVEARTFTNGVPTAPPPVLPVGWWETVYWWNTGDIDDFNDGNFTSSRTRADTEGATDGPIAFARPTGTYTVYELAKRQGDDTDADPPPSWIPAGYGATLNVMSFLLRGGFTRHQAQLILRSL